MRVDTILFKTYVQNQKLARQKEIQFFFHAIKEIYF